MTIIKWALDVSIPILPTRHGNLTVCCMFSHGSAPFRSYLRGMETPENRSTPHLPQAPFRSYLRGMETNIYISTYINCFLFRSYLRGMETGANCFLVKTGRNSDPTYEAWKLGWILSTLRDVSIPILPTRHGNRFLTPFILWFSSHSDPTYEAWKPPFLI